MDSRPIGVFDSGLGGLTVAKEIIKILPNEDIIYLGDTARVPYGTRSRDTVVKFSLEDASFLLQKNVKCIVVACNTASSLAYPVLKKKIPLPLFEVVLPTCRKAIGLTKNKRIGIIGTRATIGSKSYQNRLRKLDPNIEIFSQECPLFVPLVEEGEISGKLIRYAAEKYLNGLKRKKIDLLILGCTHYPLIKKIIRQEMGKMVGLIDSGPEVAKEVREYLVANNLLSRQRTTPKREFYVTDLNSRFIKMAEMFLGSSLDGKVRKARLQ